MHHQHSSYRVNDNNNKSSNRYNSRIINVNIYKVDNSNKCKCTQTCRRWLYSSKGKTKLVDNNRPRRIANSAILKVAINWCFRLFYSMTFIALFVHINVCKMAIIDLSMTRYWLFSQHQTIADITTMVPLPSYTVMRSLYKTRLTLVEKRCNLSFACMTLTVQRNNKNSINNNSQHP